MRTEILGLLDNTLIPNYEYSRINRENLQLPIQIKLFKKPWTFCSIVLAFLVCACKFQFLERKNEPHKSRISEVFDSELCAYLNA